ncbi:MAG: molybdopterin-dependent oxidoreductase [Myxococcaceae bacterium]
MRPPLSNVRRLMNRRDLLKLAPVAGVAAAGAAYLSTGLREKVEVRKGTCRFCLAHCGYEAQVSGGKVLRVDGDLGSRRHGFLCMHGWALREVLASKDRLRRPLLRHGDDFIELPWPDALGELAKRLNEVKARHGAEAFAVLTGWPLVRHPIVGWIHRFARAFGSPNVGTVASLCEASARMGQALTAGSKYAADVPHSRTVVLWGANPSVSAPPVAPSLARRAEEGGLIVVDPVRTAIAERASEWLCVRPGTDGALALAMANVILSEGLYDRAWVSEHVLGFEAFEALAQRHPPEEIAALTSVPREQLVRVARRLATEKPVRIWPGLGVEHHRNGVQTVRALVALEALCGRFDDGFDDPGVLTPASSSAPGKPLAALPRMRTPEPVPPPVRARPIGYEEAPLFEIYNREAQGNLLADAVLEDRPYPVRALMLIASNFLVTGPDSPRVSKAVDKLELLTVVSPFLTASAQRADLVLPASTFAEGIAVEGDEGRLSATGVVDPVGESWPDWKVLFELARALGLESYFPWRTIDEAEAAPKVEWMRDDAHQPVQETAGPFPTPSGKLELASALLAQHGHPALPEWTPPEPATAEFPLRLVTGPRTRAFINSQFRQIPSVLSQQPEPLATIHPSQASRLGLTDGERVAVVTARGRLVFKAHVTDGIHPETVVVPAGWESANPNAILPAPKRDPISGFPEFRGAICRLERA